MMPHEPHGVDSGPSEGPSEADEVLAAFMRDRDVPCPNCGYNLRNLMRTKCCPECECPLVLSLTGGRVHVGMLVIAVMPSFVVLLFAVLGFLSCLGRPGEMLAFGATSAIDGLITLMLLKRGHQFTSLERGDQLAAAVALWLLQVFLIAVVFGLAGVL